MDVKNVFDVSSYFFFEATGDSEADVVVDPNIVTAINHEDDDAESCSYILSGFPFVCDVNNGFDAQAVHVDDEVEEGEEVHSYRTWSSQEQNGISGDKKSNDSSEKVMSEMEKNKLFWETCLAS
ncbi:uncharacterized protein LOC116108858 [Pistacia vera]|uniref:Uncharacterized protein n=1 Tax=Pistacia integerrima TaxID=434235 RepID=A0ACC0ZG29_9ROSI|nr:uncharacterized protein LOC116108783 [Pistacia vera]XP_031250956.1 uncharacterized protein LOC116108858 [Pistacia vera]KAJ0052150.1 hypothetical protein Pint_01080 [Pistacia integerrima]